MMNGGHGYQQQQHQPQTHANDYEQDKQQQRQHSTEGHQMHIVSGTASGSGTSSSQSPPLSSSSTRKTPSYAHHAIKIIPEDVELSSGMHRSRSSSIQLHLPPLISLNGGSGPNSSSSSRAPSPSAPGPGAISPASAVNHDGVHANGQTGQQQQQQQQQSSHAHHAPPNSDSKNPNFSLHLLPRLMEEDEVSPPLRSPSMLKPFRPNPQLVRRRGGTVYIFAIIGGALTLFILFVVLISGGGSGASSLPPFARRPGHALSALSSSSSPNSRSISRLSSYLGSYLPFLDTYYTSAALSFSSSAYLFGHATSGVHTLHPILPLLRAARTRADTLVSRQSSTLTQAVSQYRKRYKRDPPRGFDKWWSFAKARNHTLVDEYDAVMRDLRPFAELAPSVLKARTRTLAQLPGVSLITIKDGKAQIHSKSGKWAPALALQEMMNAFVGTLPDMEIAVNEKPEGRVLPGRWKEVKLDEWEDEDFPLEIDARNETDPLASALSDTAFKADWRRDGSVWEAFQRACPPDSAARRLVESVRSAESASNSRQMRLQVPSAAQQQQSDVFYASALSRRRAESSGALPRTRELSFNRDLDAAIDLCSVPSMHTLHSAFYSDTRSIQYLYPLFSPSKPTGFADLLIPFHQYWSPPSEVTYENEYRKGRSKTPMDLDWEGKDDKIYWRGKVLRGAETPPGHFTSFQKPRLVKHANDDGSYYTGVEHTDSWKKVTPRVPPHRVLVTINATSSSLVSMSAPGPRINDYVMDVALACDPQLGECAEQERLGYKVLPPSPLSDAWKHKYVVDLDEVGLSPKFPAVIESKSAVVKSSMQREFWQDWIVPWYHYIPLSSSYAELYNIQAFFSGFPAELKNRISTSASTPSKTKQGAAALQEGEAIIASAEAPVNDDDDSASSYLLSSDMESLKPINPNHGDVFDGDLALRDIANQGAQWRREHMRREDMEVYVFRLMLEWARLTNEDNVPLGQQGAGKAA